MNKKALIEVPEEEVERRIQLNKLSLIELTVQDESRYGQYVMAIIGKVRVANVGFEKFVYARVTFNNWASYRDYSGSYIESSQDGSSDVFAFGFTRRDKRPVNVEFALAGTLEGKEYWENNGGKNYCFHLSEDPLNDPTTGESEPGVVTTWRVAEESSPDKQEEIVFDTSSYPHFEAHPLTPTKLNYYTTLHRAPEEEVIAAKAPDTKHIRAFNALAIGDLFDAEVKPANPENGPVDDAIEATTATVAEAGVCMTGEETQDGIDTQAPVEDQQPVEDPIEPVQITKPKDDESPDDVFDKLEKQKEGIQIDVQIFEEPGTDGERKDVGPTANDAGAGKKKDKKQAKEEKKKKKEEKKEKKDDKKVKKDDKKEKKEDKKDKKEEKKDKKKSKKGKAPPVPQTQQNEAQNADADTQEQKNGKEQKPASENKNGDDQSVSSKKERIDDEDSPKKPKKGFLNKMACCGKAEPD